MRTQILLKHRRILKAKACPASGRPSRLLEHASGTARMKAGQHRFSLEQEQTNVRGEIPHPFPPPGNTSKPLANDEL